VTDIGEELYFHQVELMHAVRFFALLLQRKLRPQFGYSPLPEIKQRADDGDAI